MAAIQPPEPLLQALRVCISRKLESVAGAGIVDCGQPNQWFARSHEFPGVGYLYSVLKTF